MKPNKRNSIFCIYMQLFKDIMLQKFILIQLINNFKTDRITYNFINNTTTVYMLLSDDPYWIYYT